MCMCDVMAVLKSFCIDGTATAFTQKLKQVGTHTLSRITLKYKKAKGFTGNMMKLIPASLHLNYLFISVGSNLLVHLCIDLEWSM